MEYQDIRETKDIWEAKDNSDTNTMIYGIQGDQRF